MQKDMAPPIKRSNLRLAIGKRYFIIKKKISFLLSNHTFAKTNDSNLPYKYFSHQTPLLRQLKDVDMYLQYNKIENLKLAVKRINNVTLHPGETFSYWKLIGKPTKRKGYKDGMILKSGEVTSGTGGGLCQLSNLIYWITIHTPLTIVERHRHGYDVFPDSNRTQPFGSGATCFYNYLDLMIKNNTSQDFSLKLEINEAHLRGSWYSNKAPQFIYEVYEKEHIMRQEYWGGYTRHNTIFRKKFDLEKNPIDDEFVVENHAIMMYAPFLPEAVPDNK